MSRSTITAREPRLLITGIVLILLSACGPAKVEVKGSFPEPLMEPLPLNMGIWYTGDFANHEFFDEATSREESSWLVKTGQAQVQMWDTLWGGMFQRTVHLQGEPGSGQSNKGLDAVLIPHIEELQYAIPAHTNVKVYEIWMRYRFELVSGSGAPIAEWTMTSYGKTPTAFMQSDEGAVNLAAVMALRDAGANFATNFTQVPQIQGWLDEKWSTAPAGENP